MSYEVAVRDEDWLRTRTWDVRQPDGSLVYTLDQLCGPFGPDVDTVRYWVVLPAWEAAPSTLKAEATAYLMNAEAKALGENNA